MRCHICDKALSELEIVWNKDIDSYEPCTTCLEIAYDAAFSNGFHEADEDLMYILDDDGEYTTSYFPDAGFFLSTSYEDRWDD